MNVVKASCPTHSVTRNRRITCILVKSPLNSCCVISYTRPMICSSDSPIVSPIFLNSHGLRGARIVYQRFVFHLSRCLRAAARAFALTFFAMGSTLGGCIAGATPLASLRQTTPISRTPSARHAHWTKNLIFRDNKFSAICLKKLLTVTQMVQ